MLNRFRIILIVWLIKCKCFSEKIITDLGQPELELTDDLNWLSEYYVDASILVYKNEKLNIFLNPETLKIKEIILGELDKTNYTVGK